MKSQKVLVKFGPKFGLRCADCKGHDETLSACLIRRIYVHKSYPACDRIEMKK
jgi:hypothetical protein